MRDDILSYREMCDRERVQTLQRGMNYRINSRYSLVLMSRRANAPYRDRVLEDGQTIEYEGHDVPRTAMEKSPKVVDQPRYLPSGKSTQNGLFADTVDAYRRGEAAPELVRVFEKIFPGVWSDKGFFSLIGYEIVPERRRTVFKFYLRAVGKSEATESEKEALWAGRRLIPAEIKKEVWRRDGGKCVLCGATENLHFDHDIPWSKGGSSIAAENVRVLCARHNILKRDKIE